MVHLQSKFAIAMQSRKRLKTGQTPPNHPPYRQSQRTLAKPTKIYANINVWQTKQRKMESRKASEVKVFKNQKKRKMQTKPRIESGQQSARNSKQRGQTNASSANKKQRGAARMLRVRAEKKNAKKKNDKEKQKNKKETKKNIHNKKI
jgi:hypothetical protein